MWLKIKNHPQQIVVRINNDLNAHQQMHSFETLRFCFNSYKKETSFARRSFKKQRSLKSTSTTLTLSALKIENLGLLPIITS